MFVGRGARKEMAKSLTQILNSLKTEARTFSFFVIGALRREVYTEGWSQSQNMGLGKVCPKPQNNSRQHQERHWEPHKPNSGWCKFWLQKVVIAALGCFLGAVGVLLANADEECRAFLRKVSWHVSPAVSVRPEEKPRQDYCVTRGEVGSGICSSQCIFGKHISIFNLHQIWSGTKSSQCVSFCLSSPGQLASFVQQIPLGNVSRRQGILRLLQECGSLEYGISLVTAHGSDILLSWEKMEDW